MKTVRQIIALAILGTSVSAYSQDAEWLSDYSKAVEQAKSQNKAILLDFTGSDWCGWCIKFDKETLSTDKFADYAKAHLELVVVDFPNKKPQSDELKAANKALGVKYGVDGYPTFVVLNADGKEIGRQVGYAPGGPEAFIAQLQGFSKK